MRLRMIVLCLLGCDVWRAASKTLQEDTGIKELTLKVHLSDATTLQPLAGATVELFTNHTSVTTETSAADGNAFLRFPYRLGTPLVVTATRQGYVPNSAPWRPTRLPVFSTLSLDLLPERSATLMVYDDVVQIISGSQGSGGQSWVQFQRRALSLPPNTSYTNLTALLTVASSPSHMRHFPYLQGLGGNGTGAERRFELTPVAAISVHLLASEGVELQVNEPISISVPLPADSGLKENDHIPAWRFDPRLGAWLKSSLGYVQREGDQLTLTYIAPQLGYWVAAMSPLHTGPMVAKDISTYHTVFLLAILGGMALILLCLLCLLLYYCRRRCVKPRLSHRKLVLSAGLDASKRDQATSMSHLNLISSEVQLELVSTATEPDMTTPMLKLSSYDQHLVSHGNHSRSSLGDHHSRHSHGSSLGNLTPRSRGGDYRRSADTFPLKTALSGGVAGGDRGYRQSYASVCSSSANQALLLAAHEPASPCSPPLSPTRGEASEGCVRPLPPDYLLSRSVDHLERPPPLPLPRPGQLLCCASVDLLSGGEGGGVYPRRARPTLVIPAHYMRLPGEHPLCGQALLLQMDQQSDLETIQAEINAATHSQQPPGHSAYAAAAPANQGEGGGDGGLNMSESLSIPTALGDGSGLVEMNGEDTLLAERTLMELRGGKPLPHPRAWFVSLDGRSNAHIRHSYIDLQRAGCHGNGAGGGGGGGGRRHGNSNDASLDSGVDLNEPRGAGGRRWRERAREEKKKRKKEREEEEEGAGKGEGPAKSPAPPAAAAYTQLVYVDDLGGGGGEGGATPGGGGSPQTPDPRRAEEGGVGGGGGGEGGGGEGAGAGGIQEEAPSSPSSSSSSPSSPPPPAVAPPPAPPPEDRAFRTERAPPASAQLLSVSPDDDAEEEKKSPWQKREERPLLAFNLK